MSLTLIAPFIAFEGLDGSGKSTQVKMLTESLERIFQDKDIGVHTSKEPTVGPIGTLVRKVLTNTITLMDETLEDLFILDRNEHVYGKDGILERSNRKEVTITDRYFYTGIAYDTSGLPIRELMGEVQDDIIPSITFYIGVTPEVSIQRINARCKELGTSPEIYETEEHLSEINSRFYKIFNQYKKKRNANIIFIDGEQSPAVIHEEIITKVLDLDYFRNRV